MGINIIEQRSGDSLIEYEMSSFIKENNDVGGSKDDFEIMQLLGKGGFSEVLKVKSKKNFGIYAMKKVDLGEFFKKYPDKEYQKYYENEKLLLNKLSHPNIIKCYNIFEENKKYVYFIMEFMNNGDLESYHEGIRELDLYIPEDKLWDIYYKCLCGLDYLHKEHIIHRDIKLPNLFLDDQFNVKIGDFNISAVEEEKYARKISEKEEQIQDLVNNYTQLGTKGYKAPEIENNLEYGSPVDIYAMGITFYILCYGCHPTKITKKKNRPVSKELNDFIFKMLNYDPKNRPTSREAMLTAKKFFIKTYVKNTSIKSAIYCFLNFSNFVNFFKDNQKPQPNKKISNLVFNIIQSIGNNDNEKVENDLYDLRKCLENIGLDSKSDKLEISLANSIIYFIIGLNTELNEKNKAVNLPNEDLKILSKNHEFNPGTEEYNFKLINNTYNKKILSFISKNFFSFIKTVRTCYGCRNSKCSFSKLYFIPINVNILIQKNNNLIDINIKNGIECLKNTMANIDIKKGKKCKICNKVSQFQETKSFYHTAKNLIILLDRGENFENKTFINFDENLYLNQSEIERYNHLYYQLTGIIEKVGEEYISFVKKNNIWTSNKGEQFNFENVKKVGLVVALFYYSEDKNLILKFSENIQNPSVNNNNNFNINNPGQFNNFQTINQQNNNQNNQFFVQNSSNQPNNNQFFSQNQSFNNQPNNNQSFSQNQPFNNQQNNIQSFPQNQSFNNQQNNNQFFRQNSPNNNQFFEQNSPINNQINNQFIVQNSPINNRPNNINNSNFGQNQNFDFNNRNLNQNQSFNNQMNNSNQNNSNNNYQNNRPFLNNAPFNTNGQNNNMMNNNIGSFNINNSGSFNNNINNSNNSFNNSNGSFNNSNSNSFNFQNNNASLNNNINNLGNQMGNMNINNNFSNVNREMLFNQNQNNFANQNINQNRPNLNNNIMLNNNQNKYQFPNSGNNFMNNNNNNNGNMWNNNFGSNFN